MKKDPAITFELTAGNWFPAGGEDAEGEDADAGPSKKGSPPPTKKSKRDKEEDDVDREFLAP